MTHQLGVGDDNRESDKSTRRGQLLEAFKPKTNDARIAAIPLDAWNFTVSAMTISLGVLESRIADQSRSPSDPILDLYLMGLWPLGDAHGKFHIYVPSGSSSTG